MLSDFVSQVGTDIKKLITRLDHLNKLTIKDTGWYDITSNVNIPSGSRLNNPEGKVYLRRIGNIVYLMLHDFGWTSGGRSKEDFFDVDITKYTRPIESSKEPTGLIARSTAHLISLESMDIWGNGYNMVAFEWLGPTNLKVHLHTRNGVRGYSGITSWVTDTPFPKSNQLVGIKYKP